jgi:hypothetical protein
MKKEEIYNVVFKILPENLFVTFREICAGLVVDKLISLDVLKYDKEPENKHVTLGELVEKSMPGALFECDKGSFQTVAKTADDHSLITVTDWKKLTHIMPASTPVRWMF